MAIAARTCFGARPARLQHLLGRGDEVVGVARVRSVDLFSFLATASSGGVPVGALHREPRPAAVVDLRASLSSD